MMEDLFWPVKPLGNVANVSRRVRRVADRIVGLAEGDVDKDIGEGEIAFNQINDFTSEKVKAEAAAFAETRRYEGSPIQINFSEERGEICSLCVGIEKKAMHFLIYF